MVECLLGHRTFDALWCAPYDDLSKDPATFCEGIRSAVRHVRVKLKVALQGATFGECARKLAKGLLTIEPACRASVAKTVAHRWYDAPEPPSPPAAKLRATSPSGSDSSLDLACLVGLETADDGGDATPPDTARRRAYCETPSAVRKNFDKGFLKPVSSDKLDALATDGAATLAANNRAYAANKFPKIVA